jgi:hypothetical protein
MDPPKGVFFDRSEVIDGTEDNSVGLAQKQTPTLEREIVAGIKLRRKRNGGRK